jgi:hypothetical protein
MSIISHYHITIESVDVNEIKRASKLIHGKPTSIDLVLLKSNQIDRMITKYQKGISKDNMLRDVKILLNENFNVVRFKLEQILNNLDYINVSINSKNYIEIHIKVEYSKNQENINGFRISRNILENEHFFYNARIRSKKELLTIINGINYIKKIHNIKSIHYEYIIYDSNVEHDNWWL